MSDDLSIGLVGIGGYGGVYVSALLDSLKTVTRYRFAAGVDPCPSLCDRLEELHGRKIPVYDSLDALYASQAIDLIVIASPFHLHCRHTVKALQHGSHVLCEKPLCVTVQQAQTMLRAQRRARRHVAIGYQWSFSPAIQALKQDIRAGAFGAPKRLKTMVLWPRDEAYYRRNGWAGKQRGAHRQPIYDSPVSNACAHYLHNMLYVLGDAVDRSAVPARVTAELYRAHPIQNYDTAAVRCWTEKGVEVLFMVSHATRQNYGPELRYEFENATITYAEHGAGEIVAQFHDGSLRSYGSPWESSNTGKLWTTLAAIQSGGATLCGIEAASAQTAVSEAAIRSAEIVPFPDTLVRIDGEAGARRTWVDGLEAVLSDCFLKSRLPSELGVEWAVAGREVHTATLQSVATDTPLVNAAT